MSRKQTPPTESGDVTEEMLTGYDDFLRDVKIQIRSANVQAMRAVKNEITAIAARPQAAIRDDEVFSFLALGDERKERELKRELIYKIRDFLLELGKGFAFLGAQFHLEVGGRILSGLVVLSHLPAAADYV